MAIVRLSEYGCEVVKSRGIIRSETSDGSSRLCRSLFDLRMAFAVKLVGIAYEAFEQCLDAHHIAVTVRREMGADINAACGQLRAKFAKEQEQK